MSENTLPDEKLYPRLTKLGIPISRDNEGPAGVPHEPLKTILTDNNLWERFVGWCGDGITMGMNGTYPDDVEAFLAGRANYD